MVIAKQFIQTPYIKYSVRLTSVAVRKLTVMEWTILRIANDYSVNPKYKTHKLSRFFEDILGMDRSELLIRPCINSLLRLKLIEIDGYTSMALASDTVVSKIHLTDAGLDALRHNYIPGESKDTEECIYYDLVSGTPKDYLLDQSLYDPDGTATKITNKTAFDVQFPGDEIVAGINAGTLYSSKYKNSNSIAQDAVSTSEEVVWSTGLLMLDQNDAGSYTCNYPLTSEIYAQLAKMTAAPFKSTSGWTTWNEQDELPKETLLAKFALVDMEKYIGVNDYIFVSSGIWAEVSKKFKKSLKGTTCIVFGADRFDILPGDTTVVFVPFLPENKNAVIMVPGKDVICASQKRCRIDGRNLDMWFSYRAPLSVPVQDWFADEIIKASATIPELMALLFLPVIDLDAQLQMEPVKRLLNTKDTFAEKVSVLQKLDETCGDLRITLPDYSQIIDDLVEAIDYLSADTVVDDLMTAYADVFLDCDEQIYAELVIKAAAAYGFRTGIIDLHKILACIFQSMDINISDFMQLVDSKVFSYIPSAELDGLFDVFADTIPEQIPEMSVISKDYNDLIKNLKLISGLLRGIGWHGAVDRDSMLNGIINCSVLPKVRQTVTAVKETILDLQGRGCSVFSEGGSCYGISERLDNLEQMLSCFIYPSGEVATVYLIDTCVFLHSPDILSYFKDDEMVRIPFTVLRELDYHKDNNPDLSLKKCAAFACKQIESKTLIATRANDDHFAVEPRDYPEMLPDGFSAHKHDDLILSASLRYKLLNPRILTDDTNFRNIARTQGVDPIAWDKFVTERGGNAVRGQGNQVVTGGPSSDTDSNPVIPESDPSPKSEDKPQEVPSMSVEKLYAAPLHTAAKKFGLNTAELSLLLSNKMKTCGDLIKADELYLHGLYKKKKAFLVNHLLEVRKKMKTEADRLSCSSEGRNN